MIALIIFLVAAVLLLAFTFLRRKSPAVFRKIEAYERLNRAVGLAVEGGTRLHVSIGRGNLFTARGGSALAGLAMLRRLSERTSLSDHPPVVTSGDASLAILSQDTLQAGYRAAGAEDQYRFTTGRLTGLTPFAFAAGTIPIMRDEKVSANVIIGDLGPEAALLADAADTENADLNITLRDGNPHRNFAGVAPIGRATGRQRDNREPCRDPGVADHGGRCLVRWDVEADRWRCPGGYRAGKSRTSRLQAE